MKSRWNLVGVVIAVIGVLSTGMWLSMPQPVVAQQAQAGKVDNTLSIFMRKKLEASSLILEGLTTEDEELIVKGAKALNELSKAEKWNILTDAEYREQSIEFRNIVQKLIDAGEKKQFDAAALRWVDATMACIECHKHVRKERSSDK